MFSAKHTESSFDHLSWRDRLLKGVVQLRKQRSVLRNLDSLAIGPTTTALQRDVEDMTRAISNVHEECK
jgi:hypothetical protein